MRFCCTVIACLLPCLAPAEVTDSAPNGFTVINETIVAADADAAFAIATQHVGQWWDSNHTVSGDASRMSIDATPQGCFCEDLGGETGVVHLTVTFSNPGTLLRMTGGLGPLGLMGVNGNMLWEFDVVEGGTRVTWTYTVGGYSPEGLDRIAPSVDYVLASALQRFKDFTEIGDPEHSAQ